MEKTAQGKLGKTLVLVMTLLMIGVNVLAGFPIINGKTTQQISDAYPNLFTPAGSTFSIWGIIYLALLLFAVYQLGGEKEISTQNMAHLSKLKVVYAISCAINIAWLICWQYDQIAVTLVLMLCLLLSLLTIMVIVKKSEMRGFMGVLLKTAFGLYSGWITVATVANVTVFFVSVGWNGGGIAPDIWTVATLLVAALIGCSAVFYFKSPVYALVLLWAYWGILRQHLPGGIYAGKYTIIVVTLAVCMVAFFIDALVMAWMMIKRRKAG